MADRIKNYQQEADQITTLKEIRTDLGVTPSSYTPDATVVTKDRVVTFAQAEEELVVLSDIEKGVKQQVTEVDIAQKDIANIKALLQGHLYDYQTDTTSAYTKSVPSGAMPYAGLEKIGGKTVVWNQLYRIVDGTLTGNGVTITNNATAHTITLTGTCTTTATIWLSIRNPNDEAYIDIERDIDKLTAGHKYATIINGSNIPMLRHTHDVVSRNTSFILTGDGGYGYVLGVNVTEGQTYNATFKVMLIDLTLMFGAGNEPTIEQFEAMFPSDWYNDTYGTLLSAGVTSVISKDTNNATLQTYSIPASIQALEGYGWSAGNAYNYVDFERKVFVQNVARVDISSLNGLEFINASSPYYRIILDDLLTQIDIYYSPLNGSVCANIVCEKYATAPFDSPSNRSICYGFSDNLGNILVEIFDDTYNSLSAWKTAMNGVYLYYQLATSIETDISAYLTDDNLIQVESGGTLTFPNVNGDDYRLPVPSEEEYMIDLQEAINNG